MMMLSVRRHALALGFGLGLVASTALAQAPNDPVVAVVNGTSIHMSQLVEFQRSLPPQYGQAPYEALLDIVISNQLVHEAAKRDKIENDPAVKAAVKQLEQRIYRQAWMNKKIKAEVSDATVQKAYDEMVKNHTPGEEVHARHILLETEDQAKQVIADLAKGGDFAEMAKQKSKDPSAVQNSGDLGWFGKGDMVPQFAEAAFAMKPGELSKQPVQTQFGWHVIKVEEKRVAPPPTLEQAKPMLREQLAEQSAERLVNDLKAKAKIKRFSPDGKPLADEPAGEAPKAEAPKGKKK